jgi:hypothetical protein
MEADNLGQEEGALKLEDHLKLFLGHCNWKNASITNSNWSPSMSSTEEIGRNIPISRNSKEGV